MSAARLTEEVHPIICGLRPHAFSTPQCSKVGKVPAYSPADGVLQDLIISTSLLRATKLETNQFVFLVAASFKLLERCPVIAQQAPTRKSSPCVPRKCSGSSTIPWNAQWRKVPSPPLPRRGAYTRTKLAQCNCHSAVSWSLHRRPDRPLRVPLLVRCRHFRGPCPM